MPPALLRRLPPILLLLAMLCSPPPAPAAQPLPSTKRLLIVAPERFHGALADYLRHKRRQLPAELVSLEAALRGSKGVDDPERLKVYLYDAWKRRVGGSVGYVLLVGDADVLPVRYMVLDRVTAPAFDYAFYPSDLYYSDLAKPDGRFDDWNAQKEWFHAGYFGEVRGEKNKKDPINFDQVDYRPDVAVGRWPVSAEEEVRRVAAKTMAYENAVVSGSAPGLRRAGLFAVGGWVDSRGLMDRVAASLPAGWSVEKRYYADDRRNDKTPPPVESELHALLNSGVGLVCHTGHGSDTSWEGCFHLGNLVKVNNARYPPVMISVGCSTARFATLPPYEAYVDVNGKEHAGTNDGREVFTAPPPPPAPYQRGKHNPPGLGESLLRAGAGGAVAYIGCNTGSQPCALTLLEGFARALGASKGPRLGDLWSRAVAHYYERERLATIVPDDGWYPASIFFQGMKFMLFGDPSLRLPAPG